MDQRLHPTSGNVIVAVGHKGFFGEIRYYDVVDGYGAKAVFHGKVDRFHLEIPDDGDKLAKNWEELEFQWKKLINSFLERHPEYDKAVTA